MKSSLSAFIPARHLLPLSRFSLPCYPACSDLILFLCIPIKMITKNSKAINLQAKSRYLLLILPKRKWYITDFPHLGPLPLPPKLTTFYFFGTYQEIHVFWGLIDLRPLKRISFL